MQRDTTPKRSIDSHDDLIVSAHEKRRKTSPFPYISGPSASLELAAQVPAAESPSRESLAFEPSNSEAYEHYTIIEEGSHTSGFHDDDTGSGSCHETVCFGTVS